ncbi:unnamed protein product [Rotaria sp. Silwood2]|nr:unnamed protein product [Rotaria sp. Silwood2]
MHLTQLFIGIGGKEPFLMVLGKSTHDRTDLTEEQKALPDLNNVKAFIIPPENMEGIQVAQYVSDLSDEEVYKESNEKPQKKKKRTKYWVNEAVFDNAGEAEASLDDDIDKKQFRLDQNDSDTTKDTIIQFVTWTILKLILMFMNTNEDCLVYIKYEKNVKEI